MDATEAARKLLHLMEVVDKVNSLQEKVDVVNDKYGFQLTHASAYGQMKPTIELNNYEEFLQIFPNCDFQEIYQSNGIYGKASIEIDGVDLIVHEWIRELNEEEE